MFQDANCLHERAQAVWKGKGVPVVVPNGRDPCYLGLFLDQLLKEHPDIRFVFVHPKDFPLIRMFARDLVDFEDRSGFKEKGFMAYMRNASIIVPRNDPAFEDLKSGTVWGIGNGGSPNFQMGIGYQEVLTDAK
ncbi:MAG: hypothetical protein WC824_15175 [Bacteroidota bacterium]|jgi:hypothetical protein